MQAVFWRRALGGAMLGERLRARRPSGRLVPFAAISVLAIGALAALLAALFVWERGFTHMYLANMPATVMWACGFGAVGPSVFPQPLQDFIVGTASNLPCDALAGLETVEPSSFVFSQIYLAASVALSWAAFGIDYRALILLAGLLHGAYAVGGYWLARLYLPIWASLAVGAVLAVSPLALAHLDSIRDYSKAPFIIWGVALLIMTVRARTPRSAMLLATAAGLVAGIGTGFRIDVAILLPIGLAVLAIVGCGIASLRYRFLAVTLFALGYGVAAFPVFAGTGAQSNGGFLMLQGLTVPYTHHLAVVPASYDLGARYSDELTYYTLASELETDDRHVRDVVLGQSTRYALPLLPLFSADIAARATKAAGWSAGLHGLLTRRALDPAAYPYPSAMRAGRLAVGPYSRLAVSWLPWLGLAGLTVLLWHAYSRAPREALALVLILVPLTGYGAFQFAMRNVFHLEAVTLTALAALLTLPFAWRGLKPVARPFFVSLGLAAAFGAAAFTLLALYQASAVSREVDALMSERRPVAVDGPREGEGGTYWRIGRPADAAEPVDHAEPDGGFSLADVSAAHYAVRLGGDECPASPFDLAVEYAKHPQTWQSLDRAYHVPARAEDESVTVIVAAFYSRSQALDRIVVPQSHAACVEDIARLAGETRLPSVFGGVFSLDGRMDNLYQRPGWFQ